MLVAASWREADIDLAVEWGRQFGLRLLPACGWARYSAWPAPRSCPGSAGWRPAPLFVQQRGSRSQDLRYRPHRLVLSLARATPAQSSAVNATAAKTRRRDLTFRPPHVEGLTPILASSARASVRRCHELVDHQTVGMIVGVRANDERGDQEIVVLF